MATKKNVLSGKKISNRHSTYIPEAKKLIVAAKKDECVTKVVLSRIKTLRPSKRRLKCKRVPSGLHLSVRGTNAQQELYVYTNEPDAVWQKLKSLWKDSS